MDQTQRMRLIIYRNCVDAWYEQQLFGFRRAKHIF
jgi:hypothetical protein